MRYACHCNRLEANSVGNRLIYESKKMNMESKKELGEGEKNVRSIDKSEQIF